MVGPVVGWTLGGLTFWRLMMLDPVARLPSTGAWIWLGAMMVLMMSLIIGHMNYHLGIPLMIKSAVGWGKGWGLFFVFIFAGSCGRIRAAVLGRACNIVGLQTMLVTPLMVAAPSLGIPGEIWVSPLQAIGGPGPEFFAFRLYSIDPDDGLRWSYFAPWAPAAGIVGVVYLTLALTDDDRRWKFAGVTGATLIAFLVQSRLALIGLPAALLITFGMARANQRWALLLAAAGLFVMALSVNEILHFIADLKDKFDNFRPDSTRVRNTLQAIATHRYAEAPWFGHGIQDKGMHDTEFMPIGSHHTWNGMLFMKGLSGVIALAVAMIWTTLELSLRLSYSALARTAYGTILCMWLYSFGENLEILVYLFWPGLLIVGRAMAAAQTRHVDGVSE